MDGIRGPPHRPPREGLRLLPLVPVVALLSLAICLGSAYAWHSVWPHSIYPQLASMWLGGAVTFGAAAAAVAVLFGVDAVRARRGGALRLPPLSVLGAGVGLSAFGILAIAMGQGGSAGRTPAIAGDTVLVAYVAAALVLLAVGFLGYRPSIRPVDRWARVLAAAHGLLGLGWGLVLGLVTVWPPIVST